MGVNLAPVEVPEAKISNMYIRFFLRFSFNMADLNMITGTF